MVTYLIIALCLLTYLFIGMVITHNTPLGKKYYPASPVRLILLWIFPVLGFFVFIINTLFSILFVDIILFGDNPGNPGFDRMLKSL